MVFSQSSYFVKSYGPSHSICALIFETHTRLTRKPTRRQSEGIFTAELGLWISRISPLSGEVRAWVPKITCDGGLSRTTSISGRISSSPFSVYAPFNKKRFIANTEAGHFFGQFSRKGHTVGWNWKLRSKKVYHLVELALGYPKLSFFSSFDISIARCINYSMVELDFIRGLFLDKIIYVTLSS